MAWAIRYYSIIIKTLRVVCCSSHDLRGESRAAEHALSSPYFQISDGVLHSGVESSTVILPCWAKTTHYNGWQC